MENPIKENRYINDITFATRLKHFIEYTGKKYGAGDFLIDEEWEYLLYVANKLVNWQKENMTEEDFKIVFERPYRALSPSKYFSLISCIYFLFY